MSLLLPGIMRRKYHQGSSPFPLVSPSLSPGRAPGTGSDSFYEEGKVLPAGLGMVKTCHLLSGFLSPLPLSQLFMPVLTGFPN